MRPIGDEALADLAGLYMVANTPAFLYRRYKAHPAVHALAIGSDAGALASTIRQVDAQAERTLADVVLAYAALVALLQRDYSEVTPVLAALDARHLEWAEAIRNLWDAERLSTTSSRQCPSPVLFAEPPSAARSTTRIEPRWTPGVEAPGDRDQVTGTSSAVQYHKEKTR